VRKTRFVNGFRRFQYDFLWELCPWLSKRVDTASDSMALGHRHSPVALVLCLEFIRALSAPEFAGLVSGADSQGASGGMGRPARQNQPPGRNLAAFTLDDRPSLDSDYLLLACRLLLRTRPVVCYCVRGPVWRQRVNLDCAVKCGLLESPSKPN